MSKTSWILLALLCVFLIEPSWATTTAGGGLPFDSYLTKIKDSITGPFAFTVSIIGIVGAGAALIFGGDMNGFLRSIIFIVLVLAFLVAAQSVMTAVTGKGALISNASPVIEWVAS